MKNKFNKEKYDNFMSELLILCEKKEKFTPTDLMTAHGVSLYSCIALKNLNYITPHNGYFIIHKKITETVEDVVDNMLAEITRIYRNISINKKERSKNNVPPLRNRKLIPLKSNTENPVVKEDTPTEKIQQTIDKEERPKSFKLTPALDMMTDIMSIGLKYGIDPAKMKEFTRDILILKGYDEQLG